jgi:hypothetical protein
MAKTFTPPTLFYENAITVIRLRSEIQRKRKKPKFNPQYLIELTNLNEMLKTIPNGLKYASFQDLFDFFENLLSYCKKKNYSDISRSELESRFKELFFNAPNFYDFYFRIGQSNQDLQEYKIGDGKLMYHRQLPYSLRKHISKKRERDYGYKDCYMHIRINAAGKDKAREVAMQSAKRNISIYKLVYLKEWYYDLYYRTISHFDFYSCPDKHNPDPERRIQENSTHQSDYTLHIDRDAELDNVISDINKITSKEENLNELERKILNVIDIFGLIDNSTSLHIRFLLCIICLEGLLLSREDRDYIGWKFAEKIAFLLGTSEYWVRNYHKIGHEHLFPNHVPIPNELIHGTAENRRTLFYKMRDFYGKRSGITHGTKSNKDTEDSITEEDYSLIYSILRLSIVLILNLLNKGFTHVSKRDPDDTKYLDLYIENMKYM